MHVVDIRRFAEYAFRTSSRRAFLAPGTRCLPPERFSVFSAKTSSAVFLVAEGSGFRVEGSCLGLRDGMFALREKVEVHGSGSGLRALSVHSSVVLVSLL